MFGHRAAMGERAASAHGYSGTEEEHHSCLVAAISQIEKTPPNRKYPNAVGLKRQALTFVLSQASCGHPDSAALATLTVSSVASLAIGSLRAGSDADSSGSP